MLSVFVMDNARIHHGEGILELAELYGRFVEIYSMIRAYFYSVDVQIEFLPPYSPDLNPIKEAFSKVKAFIRRHNKLFMTEGHGMMYELSQIMNIITSEDAAGYFIHAGYF